MSETLSVTSKNRLDKEYKASIIVLYIFLMISLYLIDVGITSIRTPAFIAIIVIALFQRPFIVFVYMIALLPLQEVLRLGNTTLTLMPFMAAILIVKTLILYQTIDIEALLPLMVLGMISVLVSRIRWNANISGLLFFMTWMIPMFAIQLEDEIRTNIKLIAWVYMISMIISIFASNYFVGAVKIINSSYEGYYRATGFSNPWTYGLNAVIAASFAVVLLYENIKLWVVYFVLILFFIIVAISSGTFSTVFGIILIVYYLVKKTSEYNKFTWLLAIPIGIVMVFIIYSGFVKVRGGGFDDNARFTIWQKYLTTLWNYPLTLYFGVGGGCIALYGNSLGILTAHNGLLELLLEVGVVGILLVFMYCKVLMRGIKLNTISSSLWLPLYCYLLFMLTQGGFSSYRTMLLLTIALSSSESKPKNTLELYAENDF